VGFARRSSHPPDLSARYRATGTGAATPFDLVLGDIVELDGAPWSACSRTFLRRALADLKARMDRRGAALHGKTRAARRRRG